jgi:hypothetical protein
MHVIATSLLMINSRTSLLFWPLTFDARQQDGTVFQLFKIKIKQSHKREKAGHSSAHILEY